MTIEMTGVRPETSRLSASTIPTAGRKPPSTDERRVCADRDCSTVLSRYNLAPRCRVHAAPRFVRVRGVPLSG